MRSGTAVLSGWITGAGCLMLGLSCWAGTWVQDGNSLNANTLAANSVLMDVDGNGNTPYACWSENSGGIVKARINNTWQQIGGAISNINGYTMTSGFAMGGQVPYVGYQYVRTSSTPFLYQVWMTYYNSGSWTSTGNYLNVNGNGGQGSDAWQPVVAASNGTAYIAWYENTPAYAYDIYVKKYTGSWSTLGSRLNRYAQSSATTQDIKISGTQPYVLWVEGASGATYLFASYWNGSWVPLGNAINNDTSKGCSSARLAFSGTTPYVIWSEADSTGKYHIYVKYYSGGSWIMADGVGSGLNVNANQNALSPWLIFHGTTAYAVWLESNDTATQIVMKYLDGGSWIQDTGLANRDPSHNAAAPSLAITGSRMYAAWTENSQVVVDYQDLPGPTDTPTPTRTPTFTPTRTPSPTATFTPTKTPTSTQSATYTDTPTITRTSTQSATYTDTPTITPTSTRSVTYTPTNTFTATYTFTLTTTPTPTITKTSTISPTCSVTPTITPTATRTTTFTPSPSVTPNLFSFSSNQDQVLAYPQPGRGSTQWFYIHTDGPASVRINILDMLGQACAELHGTFMESGYQRLTWDISGVAPGIYLYQMTVLPDDHSQPRKSGWRKLVIVR